MEELTDKKKQRLDGLYNKYKYKNHENFLIAKSARKTNINASINIMFEGLKL